MNDGEALRYASDDLRDDYEVVLAAISKDVVSICYASDELKNNKSIMLIAIKKDGLNLKHASKELRSDYEVVEIALKQDRNSFNFASKEIHGNKGLLKIYFTNFSEQDCSDVDFYKECKFKYNLLKEQELLEKTIPENNIKIKSKKF